MATIRTQVVNGVARILTKTTNGTKRISCSCCETPLCCMYRAPLTDDPASITIEDLPDQIEFFGYGILNKNDPEIYINDAFTLVYGNANDITFNGAQPVVGFTRVNEIRQWATLIDFAPTATECLFPNNTWSDTFADTYTAASGLLGGFSTTVTRQSLCEWRGSFIAGDPPVEYTVGINYADFQIEFPSGTFIPPVFVGFAGPVSWFKNDLSSPEGTYIDPDDILADDFYVTP